MHHSLTHSFNVELAQKYGVFEAILIHHFQFWISYNKNKGSNLKEGKTWTFQTRKEMAALFPYFDENQVRRLCEKLVLDGVLETNNFNKKGFDRTLWYAFVNEEQMIGNSKKFHERQNCQMDKAKLPNANGKSATPIPDTKPDTKQDKLSCPATPRWEKIEKVDCEGKKFSLRIDDLYTLATQKRTGWAVEEIEELWKIIVKKEDPIRDLFLFCEATIKNLRLKKSFKKLEESCPTKEKFNAKKEEKKQSVTINGKISDPATWTRPFANFKYQMKPQQQ